VAAKKRQPDDLAAQLRAQTDLFMEAEPLLPIARALREAIDARLAGESGLPLDVDGAFDDAIREVAEQIISTRLETLDPEFVLQLYAERVGDKALKKRLEAWAVRKVDELEREQRRDLLRQEASRSGSVALGSLDAGARVRVAMFDYSQISQARKEGALPPARTVDFRLVDPARGGADVISDTVLSPSSAERFPVHRRGLIGATIISREQAQLEPRLQIHAPLGYDFGEGPKNTEQIIGFVEIDEGVLILDGSW
jgi:hypothetical protein